MDSAQNASADDKDDGKRGRTKIGFVYNDLEATAGLAQTLNSHVGTTPCSPKQLAAWMNQSAAGGTFRSIVGAAKAFGLIETGQNTITLTSLGLNALDQARRGAALADAFLRVQLHSAMYSQYEGHALPPPAAIERQMESLGVPTKQKERARQTFTKSAQYAGFIDAGSGRFVKPAVGSPPPPSQSPADPKPSGGGGGNGGGGGELPLDGLLMELLRKIPTPEEGWPKEQRLRWFRTFAMNVSQIYDTGDEVVDLSIKIASGETQ